jgi:hypothetical protein
MTRKLLFGISFLLIAWAATSCEAIGTCQSCKWVSTDSSNGQVTQAPDETEYCGADLIAIKAKKTTTGTLTTVYQCR